MGDAAPVIMIVVAVAASVVAGPEMGALILGYADAIEAVAAGYSVATLTTVGAATVGAASGALSEAQKSGDPIKILEAAGVGAATGAVGAEVGGAVGGATGSPVAGATASGATQGFTKAELSGSNLNQSLKQGEIGGVTGGATQALFGAPAGERLSESDQIAKSVGGAFIGQNVSNLFSPQSTSSQIGSAGVSGSNPQSGTVTTTGQPGATPGSTALGQALRVGDPGAPIESPGGGEKTTAPVWNLASLRTKDETGS